MERLNKQDVDKLFMAILAEYLPPLIEIKPSEIEKLEEFEKEIYQKEFNKSLLAYVKPLEKLVKNLLDSANKEKYSYNVDDLSILDRVNLYSEVLAQSGFARDKLKELVPRTVEEVNLLANAVANGFDDSEILDNETRLAEAQEYLNSLDDTYDVGRRIA